MDIFCQHSDPHVPILLEITVNILLDYFMFTLFFDVGNKSRLRLPNYYISVTYLYWYFKSQTWICEPSLLAFFQATFSGMKDRWLLLECSFVLYVI